ncbi:MAG: hypothetical protein HY246_11580 [Proteobacteria bacterium]|nr:hypothetical protein [Pseudomonadota bacterium]
MFGFSFWKVIVLVAVISAVYFGYRWLQMWEKERRAAQERADNRAAGQLGRQGTAEELAACAVCGAFVARSARACGRRDCPYPR